jgi:uncharacterized delta-60 repeat protein
MKRQRTTISNYTARRPVESLENRVLFAAGDLDASFGLGGVASVNVAGFNAGLTKIDVANGRTFLGGYAYNAPDASDSRVVLAVLDSAGRPVTSFSGDGVETELLAVQGGVIDLLVQPDNKIVVLAGGATGRVLTRFHANGSLDTTFGQKVITGVSVNDIARTPAGDIVVAGSLPNDSEGVPGAIRLLRYSSSGAAKSSLTTNLRGVVHDVAVQGDGKVVLNAYIKDVPPPDASLTAAVIRVKSDFTGLDTAFSGDGVVAFPKRGEGYAGEIEVDGQGRIVTAVSETYNTTTLYRVLGNGAIDSSFAESVLTNASVGDLAIAPNTGKISVSALILAFNVGMARFNANGGLDASFARGGLLFSPDNPYEPNFTEYPGFYHDVQPDGKIVTTSGFGYVARLAADSSTPVATAVLGSDGVLRITGTEPGHDDVEFVGDDQGNAFVRVNGKHMRFSGVTRAEISTLGGNDRVQASASFSLGVENNLMPRTINGGSGNDELHGGDGRDTLLGLEGNDRLFGNGGEDLLDGGTGSDLMDGGLDADTVDYHFRNSSVFVDLQGDADDGPAGEKDQVMPSIEHIIGGNGADTLTGDGRPNFIDGRGGNDTIRGGGDNDTLVGGSGQDRLFGEAGNDFLDARDGITDLVLDGGSGTDTAKKDGSDPRTSIEVLV